MALMVRLRKIHVVGLLAALVLLSLGGTKAVYASVYGVGNFGSCSYQGCNQPAPVVVVTPTGLRVSINLANGQAIPIGGYTIVITPLNGKGSSFKQADIYVNGKLVHTTVPGKNGTASWFWNPAATGSTTVKIIIIDTNGSTVAHQFTVTVTNKAIIPVVTKPTPPAPVKKGAAAVLQHIYNSVQQAIRALPKPIAYSFPYILFVFLGINILILLLQEQRELKEYHTLQTLMVRARDMAESKKTLLELVSHYLRTPLTVLLGGIGLLEQGGVVASNAVDLKSVAERMRTKIEALIDQAQAVVEAKVITSPVATLSPSKAIWRQPGMFVPVILLAVIVLPFNYFAAHAGTLSVTRTNLLVQVVIFAMLVLALYQVFRYLQLHRRDAVQLQQITDEELATGAARDRLIADTVAVLNDDLASLDNLVAQVSGSPATKFIRNGQQDFHNVLTKLEIAGKLQGAHSTGAFAPVRLGELLHAAAENLQAALDKHHITIRQTVPEDVYLQTQNPKLLIFVLVSLLDNAVAYSPDNASIEVGMTISQITTVLTVTDHGSGIPEEKLPLLFQPFSKAAGAEVFTHEGMGFSLYLDRLIMAYLGGTITLNSKPGEGTTVTLEMPQPQA